MYLFKLLVWLGVLPFPEFRHGTGRMVWVFPWFAVKFPRVELKKFWWLLWKHRTNRTWVRIILRSKNPSFPYSFYHLVSKGYLDNWGEFVYFLKNRNSQFLFPTCFSFFGMFNVTPIGEENKKVLLWKFKKYISDEDSLKHDWHHFAVPQNFCKYRGRVCIWDYGSLGTQKIISKHHEALNRFSLEADLS